MTSFIIGVLIAAAVIVVGLVSLCWAAGQFEESFKW